MFGRHYDRLALFKDVFLPVNGDLPNSDQAGNKCISTRLVSTDLLILVKGKQSNAHMLVPSQCFTYNLLCSAGRPVKIRCFYRNQADLICPLCQIWLCPHIFLHRHFVICCFSFPKSNHPCGAIIQTVTKVATEDCQITFWIWPFYLTPDTAILFGAQRFNQAYFIFLHEKTLLYPAESSVPLPKPSLKDCLPICPMFL